MRRHPTVPVRAVLTAALVVVPLLATAQQRAMERLEALGRALRAKPVWQANYHQEFVAAGMDSGEVADGAVWVAWPDRAFFRSSQPVTRLMALSGRTVRLLDLDAGSCDDHRLSDEEWSRVPLAAVLDPGTAMEHFTVLEHSEHGFALEPRSPGGVARVEVSLGDDDLPVELLVVDPQGASNRLRFAGWKPGKEGPPEGWLPVPPEGVTCADDSGDDPG